MLFSASVCTLCESNFYPYKTSLLQSPWEKVKNNSYCFQPFHKHLDITPLIVTFLSPPSPHTTPKKKISSLLFHFTSGVNLITPSGVFCQHFSSPSPTMILSMKKVFIRLDFLKTNSIFNGPCHRIDVVVGICYYFSSII